MLILSKFSVDIIFLHACMYTRTGKIVRFKYTKREIVRPLSVTASSYAKLMV